MVFEGEAVFHTLAPDQTPYVLEGGVGYLVPPMSTMVIMQPRDRRFKHLLSYRRCERSPCGEAWLPLAAAFSLGGGAISTLHGVVAHPARARNGEGMSRTDRARA